MMAGLSSAYLYAQLNPWITGYYSAQNGNLPISQIPWAKYKDVIHFAASTDGTGNVIPYYLTQAEINLITTSHPPGKKVLVSIKDNDNNLNNFPNSTVAGTIDAFVTSIVDFVVKNGYDGVDFDWEKNINVTQYDSLLTKVRAALPASKIITMAANPNTAPVAIDSQASLDQINVMCYDLDWGSSESWYVDPLRNGTDGHPACDWDIRKFTTPNLKGNYVASSKIGVGIPYYGRKWRNVTQALHTSNFNHATSFFYRDLVSDATRWQSQYKFYDSIYGANYLSINTPKLKEFDSYTDTQFLNDAVAWQQSRGFGGFMTYTIEYEHLSTQTCDAAFPLTATLYNAINSTSQGSILTVLSATVGNTQVSLSWSACVGAFTYNLFRSSGSGGPYVTLATSLAATDYTDTEVTNDSTYYYYVAALNSSGLPAGCSNQVSATPASVSGLPLPPSNLTAISQ
jgi:hypothetical protein